MALGKNKGDSGKVYRHQGDRESLPDNLALDFLNPPDSARPRSWWHWMNGNVSRAGITADLEALKCVGVQFKALIIDHIQPL